MASDIPNDILELFEQIKLSVTTKGISKFINSFYLYFILFLTFNDYF